MAWWLEVLFPFDWQLTKVMLVDHVDSASVVNVNLFYTELTNKDGDVQWIIGVPMFCPQIIY